MQKKKESIITTAQQLFIEKGYFTVSVQEIIDASNISKGTFYNYFNSKNDLILTILQRFKDEVQMERGLILQNGDLHHKTILVKQLEVKFNLYKKYHMFSLYQTLFLERDQKLNNLIFQQRIDEVHWFAQRLTDIYGNDIKEYSIDLATQCLGAITHQIQFADMIKMEHKSCVPFIQYNLSFLESALPELSQKPFTLFSTQSIDFMEDHDSTDPRIIHRKIQKNIKQLIEQIPTDKKEAHEMLAFITKEIETDQPQFTILSTIARSLSSNKELASELTLQTMQLLQFLHIYQRYK